MNWLKSVWLNKEIFYLKKRIFYLEKINVFIQKNATSCFFPTSHQIDKSIVNSQ